MSVLDVGCGTGRVTRRMASLVGHDGRVVGLDPSSAMLGEAVRLPVPRQSAPVEWVEGVGERLPFADGEFDRVTAQFSVRNMEDWRQGIREMLRVTRPQGRIVVLDLVQPTTTLGALAMRGMDWSTRLVGAWGSEGYRWLARSLLHAPTAEDVQSFAESHGARPLGARGWLGDLVLVLILEPAGAIAPLASGKRSQPRIVWATDGSTSALAAGEWLRTWAPPGIPIDVVTVCPPLMDTERAALSGPDRAAWQRALRQSAAALGARGDVFCHLLDGEPGPELVAFGRRVGAACMVLGMKHRTYGANRLMGSVEGYLLTHAEWPVLAAPAVSSEPRRPSSA